MSIELLKQIPIELNVPDGRKSGFEKTSITNDNKTINTGLIMLRQFNMCAVRY